MLIYSETILFPVGIYLFTVNYKNTNKQCEICQKLKKRHQTNVNWHEHTVSWHPCDAILTLNIFCFLFCCFLCQLWASKYQLGILLICADNYVIFKYCINKVFCIECTIRRCWARQLFCKFQKSIVKYA